MSRRALAARRGGGGGSPLQLVLHILQGRTPRPQLMRRHGVWLIAAFFVPTLLLDIRALLLRRTEEEEADLERQRDKMRNRIDRIIAAARAQGATKNPADVDFEEFDALAHEHLAAYDGVQTEDRADASLKWETVRDDVERVRQFDQASPRTVAALVVLSRVLLRELDAAIERTDEGEEERYRDGTELETIHKAARRCRDRVGALARWYTLPSRRCAPEARPVVAAAYTALQANLADGRPVLRRVSERDRAKLLSLFWTTGRRQIPVLAAASLFQIVSGAVGTMQSMQFLEITQFFIQPDASMDGLRRMIVNFVMTRLLAIAVERVNSKLSEYGQRAFANSLSKAVYKKLVSMDMSYFETKFTRPREAQSMLLRQTSAFTQILRTLLRTLGSASGIATTALVLFRRNRPLFAVIASVTPLTIGVQELIAHFRNRWQDEQRQTEQYEWSELLTPVESRTAFAAMRYCNREGYLTRRFDDSVSRRCDALPGLSAGAASVHWCQPSN